MLDAASMVYGARRAAGLSQRELARKAGVPQSAIARIERGQQIPRFDTLAKILDACGFELRLGPKRGDGVDRSLIEHWLSVTPATRAEWGAAYGRFSDVLRNAKRVS